MDAIFEVYLAAQRRRRPSPLTLKAIRHALQQTQRWLDEHDLAAGEGDHAKLPRPDHRNSPGERWVDRGRV